MAVETKPLFHPEVIREHLRSFALPESVEGSRPWLKHWAELITSGKAETHKETALLPDFITDIFGSLLGYSGPAGPTDTLTLSRETHVEVDGQFADAALGRFNSESKKFVVALEGKGTRDPLDRPFGGRRMSAVDQAYRYAINLPCDWIVVTSMRETRLYHKGANQQTYERFETARLATDDALLRRLVFLLGAARVVSETGECHLHLPCCGIRNWWGASSPISSTRFTATFGKTSLPVSGRKTPISPRRKSSAARRFPSPSGSG